MNPDDLAVGQLVEINDDLIEFDNVPHMLRWSVMSIEAMTDSVAVVAVSVRMRSTPDSYMVSPESSTHERVMYYDVPIGMLRAADQPLQEII